MNCTFLSGKMQNKYMRFICSIFRLANCHSINEVTTSIESLDFHLRTHSNGGMYSPKIGGIFDKEIAKCALLSPVDGPNHLQAAD